MFLEKDEEIFEITVLTGEGKEQKLEKARIVGKPITIEGFDGTFILDWRERCLDVLGDPDYYVIDWYVTEAKTGALIAPPRATEADAIQRARLKLFQEAGCRDSK